MPFGTELVLKGGSEEGGNVAFVPWPKNYMPAGAFRKQEFSSDKKYRANADFVRHQPILSSLVVEDKLFVSGEMYVQPVKVDPSDLFHAKPGSKVDVFAGSGDELKKAIRCVLVMSPPEPVGDEKKDKDNVYLLIPLNKSTEFLKLTGGRKLRIQPSDPAYCAGKSDPVFEGSIGPSAAELLARQLELAQSHMQAGRHEEALVILEEINEADLEPEQERLHSEATEKCRNVLSGRAYEEARAALDGGEYERCISISKALAARYPAMGQRAVELQAVAEEALEAQRKGTAYSEAISALEGALEVGNLPEAEKLLEAFKTDYSGYEAPEGLDGPEEYTSQFKDALADKERKFKLMKQVFQALAGRQETMDNAVEQYREMKEEYPEHPEVEAIGQKLRQMGLIE